MDVKKTSLVSVLCLKSGNRGILFLFLTSGFLLKSGANAELKKFWGYFRREAPEIRLAHFRRGTPVMFRGYTCQEIPQEFRLFVLESLIRFS